MLALLSGSRIRNIVENKFTRHTSGISLAPKSSLNKRHKLDIVVLTSNLQIPEYDWAECDEPMTFYKDVSIHVIDPMTCRIKAPYGNCMISDSVIVNATRLE
jgi:hypothetical protein